MKRLDQGQLNPKLEVARLNRARASRVGGKHSIKEPIDQRINRNSEHLHMSARPHRNPAYLVRPPSFRARGRLPRPFPISKFCQIPALSPFGRGNSRET